MWQDSILISLGKSLKKPRVIQERGVAVVAVSGNKP
jgi:hypothetical protein